MTVTTLKPAPTKIARIVLRLRELSEYARQMSAREELDAAIELYHRTVADFIQGEAEPSPTNAASRIPQTSASQIRSRPRQQVGPRRTRP